MPTQRTQPLSSQSCFFLRQSQQPSLYDLFHPPAPRFSPPLHIRLSSSLSALLLGPYSIRTLFDFNAPHLRLCSFQMASLLERMSIPATNGPIRSRSGGSSSRSNTPYVCTHLLSSHSSSFRLSFPTEPSKSTHERRCRVKLDT